MTVCAATTGWRRSRGSCRTSASVSRWANTLWALPLGAAGLHCLIALAQSLRALPEVATFIQQHPGIAQAAPSVDTGFPWWLQFQHFLEDMAGADVHLGGHEEGNSGTVQRPTERDLPLVERRNVGPAAAKSLKRPIAVRRPREPGKTPVGQAGGIVRSGPKGTFGPRQTLTSNALHLQDCYKRGNQRLVR